MAVARIAKTQIIGTQEDQKNILNVIQESGLLQIDKISEENGLNGMDVDINKYGGLIADLEFAIKFLEPHAKPKPFLAGKPSYTLETIVGTAKRFKYREIVNNCVELEKEQNDIENQLEKLGLEQELLNSWKKYKYNLSLEKETKYSVNLTGNIQNEKLSEFKKGLRSISNLSAVEVVETHKTISSIVLVLDKEYLNQFKEVFELYGFIEIELPNYNMTVKERLKEILDEVNVLEGKKMNNNLLIKKLSKHVDNLYVVFDFYVWHQEKNENLINMKNSNSVFIVNGWIDKDEMKGLDKKLHAVSKNVLIEEIKIEKDDKPPIILKNNKTMKPFEFVTKLYGFPLLSEVDPTPFLASFFIVFFGLCLTDAGYGLILAGLMGAALMFVKIPEDSKGLVKLLFLGGIVTFICGIFFGGYFGLTPEQAPGFMVENGSFKFQFINPTSGNGPLTFLMLSLVLGIIHIFYGIFIDGYWKVKHKEYMDATLDSFVWLAFLSAILLFSLASVGVVFSDYVDILKNVNLFFVGFLILTQGRKQDGILKKAGMGLLSLYRLVGYASDVLSYSRLMALGLGTGIIAFAMNTLAGIAYELVPGIGIVVAIIVLILGHTLNLVLAALGAFIHSARLQFVEFFSKFMEGGGKGFKPFKRTCKYINVI